VAALSAHQARTAGFSELEHDAKIGREDASPSFFGEWCPPALGAPLAKKWAQTVDR
jgi:hypothetical protein